MTNSMKIILTGIIGGICITLLVKAADYAHTWATNEYSRLRVALTVHLVELALRDKILPVSEGARHAELPVDKMTPMELKQSLILSISQSDLCENKLRSIENIVSGNSV